MSSESLFIWFYFEPRLKIFGCPPVSHFGAPWWPFWIIEVLIEGIIESKTYLAEVDRMVQ